jgi:DNA-binding IclR family transcriptional regulator
MNDELGEKTRALLRESITSFEMLEILLLLRAHPDLSWTVSSVAARVHMPDDLVARALEALRARQLVRSGVPPLAPGSRDYTYGPGTTELAAAAEELVRDFAERRAAVLSTMSTNAIERLRSGALSAFADAFVLGSKRKDG